MISGMAGKVRLDALEESKIDNQGDNVAAKNGREAARQLVADADAALPGGVPDDSPYKKFSRDDLLAEGARLDMRLGPLMKEDELRVVLEVMRTRIRLGTAPPPDPLPLPAPEQPRQPPRKVRGLKESKSGAWLVAGQHDRSPAVAVGNGQMARLRNGAVIEMRHYTPEILQGIVNQGVKLIPIEDPEVED
jgi:hypothetical protein